MNGKTRYVVCAASALASGERKIVEAGGRSIGVFNISGEYFAVRNVCPHQQAPLCEGTLTGMTEPGVVGEYRWMRAGRVLRCPWHGWEFDIETGKSSFNPHRVRVKTYEVALEPGGTRTIGADEDDPSVETYDVAVEDRQIVIYV